jgi:hypothetical protein
MRRLLALVLSAFVPVCAVACGGGSRGVTCLAGDPFCGSRTVDYALETVPIGWQPTAPIAVGVPTDVTFQEQRCVGTSSQSGPPPDLGCGPAFAPATLLAQVDPFTNPSPCHFSVTQVQAGTLRFTRTAPGGNASINPYPLTTQVPGFCLIVVTDTVTQAPRVELYL